MNRPSDHEPAERILVAGDWHGELGWAKQVIERAGALGVTKLLHVGDLGIGPWPGDRGAPYEHKLNRIAAKNGVDLYVVPGNHSNWATLERLESRADGWLEVREHLLVAPGGLRWTWSGVNFGALGGAFSVDFQHRVAEKDWWPVREEVRPEHLQRLDDDPLDVLVSHEVPAGVDLFRAFPVGPGTAARAQVSRDLLAEAVARTAPELVLSGHWHQRRTAHLPLPEGARTGRRTVAERHQGADSGEPLTRTRVDVLDLGREYVGADGRSDQNWVLLSLADLTLEEQRAVEARMRSGHATDQAPDHPGLDIETARGCWSIRSDSATVYYVDLDRWALLRVPGEGSSTGPYDAPCVRLCRVAP